MPCRDDDDEKCHPVSRQIINAIHAGRGAASTTDDRHGRSDDVVPQTAVTRSTDLSICLPIVICPPIVCTSPRLPGLAAHPPCSTQPVTFHLQAVLDYPTLFAVFDATFLWTRQPGWGKQLSSARPSQCAASLVHERWPSTASKEPPPSLFRSGHHRLAARAARRSLRFYCSSFCLPPPPDPWAAWAVEKAQ